MMHHVYLAPQYMDNAMDNIIYHSLYYLDQYSMRPQFNHQVWGWLAITDMNVHCDIVTSQVGVST